MIYFRDFVPSSADLPDPDPLQRAQSRIGPGDSLFSATSAFLLVLQGDGNLVLHVIDDAALPGDLSLTDAQYPGVIWESGTSGSGAVQCDMQDDGNLVLYDAQGSPVWASGTSGNPGAFLRCQSDGNLVIFASDGGVLWTSDTYAGPRAGASFGDKVSFQPNLPQQVSCSPIQTATGVWPDLSITFNSTVLISGAGFPDDLCTVRGIGYWANLPYPNVSGDITQGIVIPNPFALSDVYGIIVNVSCAAIPLGVDVVLGIDASNP